MPLPRTQNTVVLLCDCGTKSHSVFISKLVFDEPNMLYEIVQIPEQQTLWARIKQAFNLILTQGQNRAIDNADQCQKGQCRGPAHHGVGEQGGWNTNQAIDTHFGHYTREQKGHHRGRFAIGIGQPGMQGEQG